MEKDIHVLYTFDGAYFLPAFLSISTLLENVNKQSRVHIHVIYSHLSLLSRLIIARKVNAYSCEVSFYNSDSLRGIFNFNTTCHFTEDAMFRLLCFRLIQKSPLIYIDPDTLVVGDITELYDEFQSNRYNLGAVPQDISRSRYFNSGVLLINTREFGRLERDFIDYYNSNSVSLKWPDQDLLNHFFGDSYLLLPQKWNQIINENTFPLISLDKGILHFAGTGKPWDKGYPLNCVKQEYVKYLRKYAKWWYIKMMLGEFTAAVVCKIQGFKA